jgi:hypothetical protein
MSTSSPEINAMLANLGVSSRQRVRGGEEEDLSSGPGSLVLVQDVTMTEVRAVLNEGTLSRSSSVLGVQIVFEDARGGVHEWKDRMQSRCFQIAWA